MENYDEKDEGLVGTYYYLRNRLHRLDGPAHDGVYVKRWYYMGKYIECTTQEEFESILALRAFW